MTTNLRSFGELARLLERKADQMPVTLLAASESGAVLVEQSAKAKIGEYQDAVGPFPQWAPLAEATRADKQRKGFADPGHDNPLLRTGEMRDSISHHATALGFVVGSTSDIAAYQEFGTRTIPPRPFLGPAIFQAEPEIAAIVGNGVSTHLRGTK